MVQICVTIDGMACSMCESHVNDAIRQKLSVVKVSSSHKKGIAVIISENVIAKEKIDEALSETGYRITGYAVEPYEKKSLFSRIFHH